MQWTELIERVAERSGLTQAQARAALTGMIDEVVQAVSEGEEVSLRGLLTVGSRWQEMRMLRSVSGRRKVMIDGRFVAKLRASRRLKTALAERTPQHWRDPEHQKAWRTAETLVGDLVLYHKAMLPTGLHEGSSLVEVNEACRKSLGSVWERVEAAYSRQIAAESRGDYLALAARRQFAQHEPEEASVAS